jgi:ribosomal protein L24E
LREAERQGFEVRKLGSGHYAVRKDGRLLLTVSGTNISSGVRRRNRHVLEQAGFQ